MKCSACLAIIAVTCLASLSGCGRAETSNSSLQPNAPTRSEKTSVPVGLTIVPLEGLESAPVLGIVIGKDKEVLHIEPSSAAERAGINITDIIEQINGIPLTNPDNITEIKRLIHSSQKDSKLKVLISRLGKTIELELMPAPEYIPEFNGTPLPTATPVWPPQDYF